MKQDLTVKTEQQIAIEKASTQVQQALTALSLDKVSNAKEASFAIESLLQVEGLGQFMVAKHLHQVKTKKWYEQEHRTVTTPKGTQKIEYYKSFYQWVKDFCNLERSQADNYVVVARLLDDNGKDIIFKLEKDTECYYSIKALRELWAKAKNDIKDEEKNAEKRIATIQEWAQKGYISPTMSVAKMLENLKNKLQLEKGEEIPTESKQDNASATESNQDNASATESKQGKASATESKQGKASATESKQDNEKLKAYGIILEYVESLKDLPQKVKDALKVIHN